MTVYTFDINCFNLFFVHVDHAASASTLVGVNVLAMTVSASF